MAKKFRKGIATFLAVVMIASAMGLPALAKELINGNDWYGDEVSVEVKAGSKGYNYMALFRPYVHGYEFGGHFMGEGEGPQTFVMLDTVANDGTTWTPDGIYEHGKSNYEVVYCCDVDTMIKDGTYYKRVNLEDSTYFDDAAAEKIRAILTNSYPYVTVEDMKAALAESGFADANKLTRNDIIAAVQSAIWVSANGLNVEDMRYQKSYRVSDNLQWGYPMHDTSSESGLDVSGNRVFKTYPETGKRIDDLVDYLLALESAKAAPEQIVITKLDIINTSMSDSRTGVYNLTIDVKLNNSGSSDSDEIAIDIYVDGASVATKSVERGTDTYQFELQATAGQSIKAVVSGTQVLEEGVYFYEPEGGRDISQSLVGVSAGETKIHAESEAIIRDGKLIEKTSSKLYADKYADVTLRVDGDMEFSAGQAADIVIALGAGIAAETNTYDSIINLVKPLIDERVNVKLGFIAVEHYDDVAMELTELSADNYEQTIKAGLDAIRAMPAGPTNLHGNIVAAKAMLDADKDVPAENKFFYVIGTGRTYNFDNADGVPTTIINTVNLKGKNYYYWGHYLWQSQRGRHTSLYMIPARYNNDFASFWADVCAWVKQDGDTYAYSFTDHYDPSDPQWFNTFYAANGSDAKALGLASSRFGWILTGLTDSGLPGIGSDADPQNALNYERAQYEAWVAYNSMKEEGYTCYALCSENVSYQNGSPYIQVAGYTGTSTIQLGHSFMNFLAGEEQNYIAPTLYNLTDANGNYEMAEDFFPKIDVEELVGEAGVGPFVEDFIGFDNDALEGYDYDFTGDLDKLVLKVGDVVYKTAKIEEANNGADATYAFTAPGASKATFTLDYYKGNGTTEERFVWNFFESVKAGTPVSLTYQLELISRSTLVGTHVTETNQSATLYPEGDREYGQLFPVPEVEYVVVPELEGDKRTELVDRYNNRFGVSIEVPGAGMAKTHDEVILMVDGSYSMDNEWPAMKEAIISIGEAVLNGKGNTQLTLMAFGMGDNEVLVHVKDAKDLAAALGELPGNLLYGRSSTNCEAGFTGVAEYIENHDESLKEVHVIFISDGNLNTDETPRAFDSNWQTWATQFGALTVAQAAFESSLLYGETYPDAFYTVFGDQFVGATTEEILTRAFGGEVTNEQFMAFAEQIWTDVYNYSGLTRGEEYPVSDAERAFVKYDKENGTYIQDVFYYTTYKSKYVTYSDRWTRTPAAAEALAQMNEVSALYVVDYDGYTSWMDTGITSEKSTFIQSNGIAGLCEALSEVISELALTPYNDVVITDYMSKWVNLDPSTIKIVDTNTGMVIWNAVDGWLIDEGRPTAKEIPVIVELVDPADYEAGGVDVIGNTSGNVYKLTWYVKDGALLRSDNYRIEYEVTVDTAEKDFVYGVEYPANGTTNIKYNDFFGNLMFSNVKVPDINTEEKETTPSTVTFESGEASNISFMLIDKLTGEVEFLYKIDIENETSFEIPFENGKISAVFIKQSTSGMFWFAEEVDDETVGAVIECLKSNNPSYKGHNAVCFGGGDHELEFKKNKFVTYSFSGDEVDTETSMTETEESVVVEDAVIEEVEEPKNNKNNKNKNKNK